MIRGSEVLQRPGKPSVVEGHQEPSSTIRETSQSPGSGSPPDPTSVVSAGAAATQTDAAAEESPEVEAMEMGAPEDHAYPPQPPRSDPRKRTSDQSKDRNNDTTSEKDRGPKLS